jgi:WD40 repeat protein
LFFLLLFGCSKKEAPVEQSGGEPEKPTGEKMQMRPTALTPAAKQQEPKSATKPTEVALKELPENVITEVPSNPIQTGLKDSLRFCGFSPDSKRLVVVDAGGGVAILDSSSWKPTKTFAAPDPFKQGDIPPVNYALSPDFKRLVFGCPDKSAHVWNLETGKEERRLKGHPDFVRYLTFSPDSKRLATGTNDPNIFVWDVATGELLKKFPHGFGIVWCIAFTADGKELLVPSYPDLQRFDPLTGKELGKHKIPDGPKSIAVSPDGKLVAYDGSPSGKPSAVNVWDRETGKIYTVPGFKDGIGKVAFVSNNILAVQGYPDSFKEQMTLWDLESKQQLSRIPLRGSFAISPDGKILVNQAGPALPDLELNIVDLTAILKKK